MKVISISTYYGSKMRRDAEAGTTKGRRAAKSPENLVAPHSECSARTLAVVIYTTRQMKTNFLKFSSSRR
jgi:hypothetical protein